MPANLELKIKVDSFREITKKLKSFDAEFHGILNQKDIYYKSNRRELLKLRVENGKQSLIRYIRNEKGKNRWSDFSVVNADDGNLEKLLKGILPKDVIVEKRRNLYKYLDTRIHLDKVKRLGYFIELETLVLADKNEAIKRFKKIVTLLGLNTKNEIRKSYRDLITEKQRNDFNKAKNL
jgi:predicted adenylyl cyclase CyaB